MSAAPTTTTGFSARVREHAAALVAAYPQPRSALLPLLHLVQSDEGFVSDAGIAFCAEQLALTKAEVQAVATFYTMYKREPVGDWLVSVCTNVPCKVAGGDRIYRRYLDELGGHSDGTVTVEHVECLGICDEAPAAQVNYEMYGRLTDDTAGALLAGCRSGSPPPALSGEPPATFREVEFLLAGGADGPLQRRSTLASAADLVAPVPPADRVAETTTVPLVEPARAHEREEPETGDVKEPYGGDAEGADAERARRTDDRRDDHHGELQPRNDAATGSDAGAPA